MIAFFLLFGCDPQRRYKILLFFIDGVPEPGSETAEVLPGTEPTQKAVVLTALDKKQMRSTKHKPWQPQKPQTCKNCHQRMTSFNKKKQEFKKPIPLLCYDCHDNYSEGVRYVHGPVAVGVCTICHESHQSDYIYLQKELQPKLCLQCHDPEDYHTAQTRLDTEGQLCTDCHNPHGGDKYLFLK